MAEVGSWVWVPDDKEHVIPGELLAITADGITAKLESGEVWTAQFMTLILSHDKDTYL
jgi:hypothetical protein